MVIAADAPAAGPTPVKSERPAPARILIAVLALAFFFGPAIAAAAGVRAPQIENHKLGALPSASDGWNSFAIFDVWATDHLPLRNVAIRANTNAERDIFGETPNYGANGVPTTTTATTAGVGGVSAPQPSTSAVPAVTTYPVVVSGTDGWLFYGGDLRNACNPVIPSATVVVQRLQRLSDILRAAGKTVVVVVAPDKSDIYSQFLPANYRGTTCFSKAQAALWAALAAHPPTGYLDMHGALTSAIASDPDTLLYRKLDTHWNGRGALIFSHLLGDRLDPALWPTLNVTALGDQNANTDLEALLGLKNKEAAPAFDVSRSGVSENVNTPARLTNTATAGAKLIPGETLFISDSFTEASRFAINPYFSKAGFINSVAASTEFGTLSSAVKGASTVVVEIVERDVVGGESPIFQTDILDHLANSLGEG
jgi:alginate O-acetyltransferase complex protein AlgJ